MPFDGKYLDSLVELVDTRRLSLIDYREFIALLRGEMSGVRLVVLDDVFAKLDQSNQTSADPPGMVSLTTLAKYFNGASHPLVLTGTNQPNPT